MEQCLTCLQLILSNTNCLDFLLQLVLFNKIIEFNQDVSINEKRNDNLNEYKKSYIYRKVGIRWGKY